MDSFEWNKIFMSVLGIAFVVMSLNFLSESLFHSENPEKPGYAVEVAGGDSHDNTSEEPAKPAYEPVGPILAGADADKGAGVFKKCAACHTNEDGAGNKVGPALYGVVGRPVASVGDFSYSSALKGYADGKAWNYEELNGFLFKPKAHVKGTSMGFGGLKKTQDRANIIAYLRSLAATPLPLPAE